MRLLVTGASGFIGQHLLARLPHACDWAATYFRHPPLGEPTGTARAGGLVGRADQLPGADPRWHRLNLRDREATREVLASVRPSLVVHLAYDKASPSQTVAKGTQHLVQAAAQVGARVLLLSTDQVFDGRRGDYREDDLPNPLNPYGRAKRFAEELVLLHGGAVVRTSLVYRTRPPDPVNQELLVTPLARGQRPRLFVDERRCPIAVEDLADALAELMEWPAEAWQAMPRRGVLHVAGPEQLDRYTFARRLAPHLGIETGCLQAARITDSGLARPPNCTLDSSRARALLRTRLRPVDEVLASPHGEAMRAPAGGWGS